MKLITTCLFFFILVYTNAQQIEIEGVVTIHNSRYQTGNIKYVPNATVRAAFTSPTATDVNGNFHLVFARVEEGTSVTLKIEKAGLEVVNKRDLQDVVIGRRTPLKIYLAPVGELVKAQTELYNVSVNALTARHDSLIERLRLEGAARQEAITELEKKLNRAIADRFEAETLLKEQLAATKKRLPEFARQLAAVNLDFASEMYRKAYNYFKLGEIEKAIEQLDEAVLDKQAEEAIANLNTFKKSIRDLDSARINEQESLQNYLQSMLLEAIAFFQQAEYDQAVTAYEQVLSLIGQTENIDSLQIAQIYWDLSRSYAKQENVNRVLEYRLKHLHVIERYKEEHPIGLVVYYQGISRIYKSQEDIEKSIVYQRKAYQQRKAMPSNYTPHIQEVKEDLMESLQLYGQALHLQRKYSKAINIFEELYALQPYNKTLRKLIQKLRKKI